MNARIAKRLRIASVRHYLANNQGSQADVAYILKKTYKAFKKAYIKTPYHLRGNMKEGHSVVLSKIHDIRERGKIEKFLDPKSVQEVGKRQVEELGGVV